MTIILNGYVVERVEMRAIPLKLNFGRNVCLVRLVTIVVVQKPSPRFQLCMYGTYYGHGKTPSRE
jgi:hypothetical protein